MQDTQPAKKVSNCVGNHNRRVSDFWSQISGIEDAARLLNIRITELKQCLKEGKPVRSCPTPEVHSVSDKGKIFLKPERLKN
ncbi:hypothetical protein H0A36_26875 [Endozoicomonas sp. SM1973]|uniref:DNA-binding protein n=1 Tax=Spartinivicinus marinus TaxID=2994442 RepID=A0A853I8K1_9GAMM|nr:hypothetical protein [Spartinivicinus marinus]MCX4030298.1 hypothetical protein [Spartinivicinus marinus]NYZ69643.1 hypothetical protein [Spartinivicinus marinus]